MEQKQTITTTLEPIRHILDTLQQAGGIPLVVGGAVRDLLLGSIPKDLDLEVHGLTPDALFQAVSGLGRIDAVGRSFGVLKLRYGNGQDLDIALPQRRNKNPGGRGYIPTPDPTLSPEEAALRRDFTWNAMALTADGQILDFFHGQEDLNNRIIRHVSVAFDEDPLRVLRAMQFAARFGMQLAPETIARCQALLPEAATLPIERIWGEWYKWAAKGQYPSYGLRVLYQTNWLTLYPELMALIGCPQDSIWHPEGDVFIHTGHVCDAAAMIATQANLSSEERITLMLSALCHDLGKPETTMTDPEGRIRSPGHDDAGVPLCSSLLERIGTPRQYCDMVVPLVREHMSLIHAKISARAVRRLAVRLSPATISDWRWLVAADASGRPPLPASDPGAAVIALATELGADTGRPAPILTGRILLDHGYTAGPQLGALLKQAYHAQIDELFSSIEEGLVWLAENKEQD